MDVSRKQGARNRNAKKQAMRIFGGRKKDLGKFVQVATAFSIAHANARFLIGSITRLNVKD